MTTLLESPVPVFLAGIIAAAILAVVFFNTRRVVWLLAIAGVVALVLIGVAVEHFIVTDREAVADELYGLAAAMEANDKNAAIAHLSPSARETRNRAQWAFARFEVQQASISNLEIEVNDLTSPPSAQARFTGFIRARDRQGEMPYGSELLHFIVEFRKEGDRWLVTGHKERIGSLGGPPDDFR